MPLTNGGGQTLGGGSSAISPGVAFRPAQQPVDVPDLKPLPLAVLQRRVLQVPRQVLATAPGVPSLGGLRLGSNGFFVFLKDKTPAANWRGLIILRLMHPILSNKNTLVRGKSQGAGTYVVNIHMSMLSC